MTTEQAVEKLGMVAVVWPKATEARRAELYAGLTAEQQEAVRVLFGYGDEPVAVPSEPETPQVDSTELIETLQRFTQRLRTTEKPAPVENITPPLEQPAAPQRASLAGALDQLAEEIENRRAAESSTKIRTQDSHQVSYPSPRQKIHTVRQVDRAPEPEPDLLKQLMQLAAEMQRTKPAPRIAQPAHQVHAAPGMSQMQLELQRAERVRVIAYIQAVLLVIGWICVPLFIWWLAS